MTRSTLFRLARARFGARRAAVSIYTMICAIPIIGIAAMAADLGLLYSTKNQLQASADAAAMAAAWRLIDEGRVWGNTSGVISASRSEAARVAGLNVVLRSVPLINQNSGNSASGDLVLGYLSDPTNKTASFDFSTPSQFNTVQLKVRRDSVLNGSIALSFARLLGLPQTTMSATGTASFQDHVRGWEVTGNSGNAGLLPLALHVNYWNQLIAGTRTAGDNYRYDPTTKTVVAGSDGVPELNLYPGSGGTQLPPGNFGTVDIGSPNNSTADISRQIRDGVNENDLSYFGGTFELGPNGTIDVNGDTGLSAGIKDDLESIKGQPRTIPLFNMVQGPGNNSQFTVVGFAGIRIVNVRLTGSMKTKEVMIQPAMVVDDAAVATNGSGVSYYVYKPVMLVR
ncbi:MAG: pilus assembly protein TadG-related protein [Phycisphaerae bacterium]